MILPLECDIAPLLRRIAQQDQTALSELYDRYAHILYAIAFKSLNSVEESEEVVLDVFSQVWRSAISYNPEKGRADAWLFMVTRSRVIDRLRSLQRTAKKAAASVEAVQIQPNQQSVDPIEHVLISERRTRMLAAIQQLPDEQRQVIELAYYQGLTQSEIAAQTGTSLGTVKTRVRLGLSKLRSAIRTWDG
jgi:RNA polymerase sigma-70 factor (ECF subfamily)